MRKKSNVLILCTCMSDSLHVWLRKGAECLFTCDLSVVLFV